MAELLKKPYRQNEPEKTLSHMMTQPNSYAGQDEATQMRDNINQMTARLQNMLDSRRALLARLRRGENIDLDAATAKEDRELSDMMVRLVGK